MTDQIDQTNDPFRIVETRTIPEIEVVRLHESTWVHIAAEHPEFRERLPSLEHAVVDTICNPTAIHRSTTAPETGYVYVSSNNVKGDRPMVVPIKVVEGTSARVATAGFRTKVNGDLLWKEGENGV